ncbi:hypothetical protein [Ramlibacter pinisoli]|uniref:DUF2946 domain-containing protein n=1 Tax=Ramlibacter pinisoli TaxID=2682844 RepID=A0A6N8IP67_9BURK|nr:hypothetical protein [Ramlibacter pinisoli]MVQ28628.1 hypothetical protein [Ramlibacter pinisoli]
MTLAAFRRTLRSHPLGWLLVLALWLPAAQWAAATHALLHLQSASAGSDRQAPAHLPIQCDLCAVAAVVGGAAPASAAPAALPPAPPLAQPSFQPAPAPRPVAIAAYRSRAPPLPHA